MMCGQVCKWNTYVKGCIKPLHEFCPMLNTTATIFQKKESGCKYCSDYDVMMETVCYIPTDNGNAIDIPVNYCPACGRRLNN